MGKDIAKYIDTFKESGGELIKDIKKKGTEHLLLETPVSYPIGYDQYLSELMKPGDGIGIGLAYHNSHIAGLPAMQVMSYSMGIVNSVLPSDTPKIPGQVVLRASNIALGQNRTVSSWHEKVQPIVEKRAAIEQPILRDKDIQALRSTQIAMGNFNEDEFKQEISRLKFRQDKNLVNAAQAGRWLLSFPEGSVESGRQKELGFPGEINGMIELMPGSISYLVRLAKIAKKEPVFFYIGVTGANNIYDPISEEITLKSQLTGAAMGIFNRNDIGKPFTNTIVDYPTTLSQIEMMYGSDRVTQPGFLEQYTGERIAQLIPPKERNFYAYTPILDEEMQLFEKHQTPIYDRRLEIKRRLLLFPSR